VISLPAGVFRLDIKNFIIYTVAGCLVWSIFLTYVGYVMGANWQALEPVYRKFEYVIVAAVVFGVIYFVYWKIRKG
jgi:membrane protein DedA with SNARE-associated domain